MDNEKVTEEMTEETTDTAGTTETDEKIESIRPIDLMGEQNTPMPPTDGTGAGLGAMLGGMMGGMPNMAPQDMPENYYVTHEGEHILDFTKYMEKRDIMPDDYDKHIPIFVNNLLKGMTRIDENGEVNEKAYRKVISTFELDSENEIMAVLHGNYYIRWSRMVTDYDAKRIKIKLTLFLDTDPELEKDSYTDPVMPPVIDERVKEFLDEDVQNTLTGLGYTFGHVDDIETVVGEVDESNAC